AGMVGMIVALVSAPRSKHSMVARTVSSSCPKSSALRMIGMGSLDQKIIAVGGAHPPVVGILKLGICKWAGRRRANGQVQMSDGHEAPGAETGGHFIRGD